MSKKQSFLQKIIASHLLFVIAFSPSPLMRMHGTFPLQQSAQTQQSAREQSVRLPVFLYHHIRPTTSGMAPLARDLSVTPEVFEEQLKYFKEHGYIAVSLNSFADTLQHDTIQNRKAFALTFDDGYEDLYLYAWPLLKKYGFSATAFIIVNRVGTSDYASWDQLRVMQQSGFVDIQSHTLNHPMLTRLPPEKANVEVKQSRRILEQRFGKSVSVFCYPYGDYNKEIIQMVRDAGYSLAFTTKGGEWHSYNSRFELSRMRLSTTDTKERLAWKIKHLFGKKTS